MSGEAEKLLADAKASGAKVDGQSMSNEKLDKAKTVMLEQASKEHQTEAAAFTEEIIAWLNEQWNEREFTAEERIFSIALATVNLRQHFPDDRGGKDFFDAVSKTAWEYYASNA